MVSEHDTNTVDIGVEEINDGNNYLDAKIIDDTKVVT